MAQQQSCSSSTIPKDLSSTSRDGYVIGVDLGGTNLRLALADSTGVIVDRWSNSTIGVKNPDEIVALICNGVETLSRRSLISGTAIGAIAAGVPGVTDAKEGLVVATSYLMGWRDVPFRALLESALGVPAAVDNDVNLGAIGEGWAGVAKGFDDFVFLAIGSGVGAGITLNGKLHRGGSWMAGEIGYMLVPGTPEAPVESGKPGALEGMVGGEGIRAQWQNRWRADTLLPADLTATQIFDHALTGEPLARFVLGQASRTLAYAIYDIALILNCPLFVLGGGVGKHPALCDAARKILEERGPRARPQLAISSLGEDAQLLGAVRLALDTAKSRTALLL